MSKSDTIQINGRHYDTHTGEVIQAKAESNSENSLEVKAKLPTKSETTQKTSIHKVAKNRVAHYRQHSKTLLRSSVKKPSFKKTAVGISQLATPLDRPSQLKKNTPKIRNVESSQRLAKARAITKNQFVRKFSDLQSHPEEKEVEHIEVRRIERPTKTHPEQYFTKPVAEKTKNPFESAVARANSHEEKLQVAKTNKIMIRLPRIVFAALVLLVVIGGFLYFEKPTVDLYLASYYSKVSARLPGWVPPGYTLQTPIAYSSGKVVVDYSDNSDVIQIVETNTTWNNSQLLNSLAGGITYKTLSSNNGQPIYVSEDGVASWIKDKVWYQLDSSTQLTNSQLQSIVANI